MAALACMPIFGIGALAVDLGLVFANEASLRAATDAAALAAVLDTSRASTIAGKSLVSNKWTSSAISSVSTGIYCPDPTLAVGSRYTASGTACAADQYTEIGGTTTPMSGTNAVQVKTTSSVPLTLARVVFSGTQLPIRASATATRVDMAGFYAGTGLISVSGGIENALLSQLLGTSISLTAVQYNGLLNANVTALSFLKTLATQLNLSAGTYASLASSSVTFGQLLQAATTVLNQSGGSQTDALSGLQTLLSQGPTSQTIPLSRLMDLQPYLNDSIGSSPAAALNAGINVWNLVSFASQLIGANKTLTIPTNGFTGLSLSIAGVASISAVTSIIQPPQTAYFGFGPVGATVNTAQVQLGLMVTVLSTSLLPSRLSSITFQLPLYIKIAYGTATLTAISCTTSPATMTISAQPGIVQVALGTVSGAATSSSPVKILSASVLGSVVGSVEIDGSGSISSGSSTAQSVTFTQTETQETPPVAKSVSSNSSATSSLLKNLSITFSERTSGLLLGLLGGLVSPTAVLTGVENTLANTVLPVLDGLVDPVISALLNALGIKLGYMDVVGTGIRCGVPVLVQ